MGSGVTRLPGSTTSLSPFSSPTHAASSAAIQNYHPPRIDLPSTLSTFAPSSTSPPFNLSSHLQSQYSIASPALAVYHRGELQRRKEQTSEELRSYVTRHYPSFIESSRSIVTIEQDMTSLTSMLEQFNAHLTHLSAPSLAYSDERLFRRGKERERELVTAGERQVKEALALEEWNEDLRATIYERKFEKAVRIIEHTWKKGEQHDKTKQPTSKAKDSASAAVSTLLSSKLACQPCGLSPLLCPVLSCPVLRCVDRRRRAPSRRRWRTASPSSWRR